MKYYQYKHNYENIPACKNNLALALYRIGEINPGAQGSTGDGTMCSC